MEEALAELVKAVRANTEHEPDGGYGKCEVCNALAKAVAVLKAEKFDWGALQDLRKASA